MRKFLPLMFGMALLVPLAACGGGDDEDSSSSSSGSASASGTEDEETTTTTEEQEEEGGGDSDEFCGVIDDIQDADFDELDFEDPEAIEVALDALDELRDAAPNDEVSEDMDQLIAGFEFLAENFEELTDPESAAELEEQFADEFEQFEAAGERVDEFSLEECGITVDGETADGSSSSGGDDGAESEGAGASAELGDPTSPPDATEEGLLGTGTSVDELDDLMSECEDGDLAACDEVFTVTSVGSPEEDYGSTCGGRLDIEDEVRGQCELTFG